jgi:hypothetical protein
MKLNEPKHTIDWTAYHKFDKLFYAKYETGKLTMNEYCQLINMAIARREAHIAAHRKWHEFRLRLKDWVFLSRCRKLKGILDSRKRKVEKIRGIDFSDTNALLEKITKTVKVNP